MHQCRFLLGGPPQASWENCQLTALPQTTKQDLMGTTYKVERRGEGLGRKKISSAATGIHHKRILLCCNFRFEVISH